jgi:16S rRNA (uracil1498-N3)-methyltransferase
MDRVLLPPASRDGARFVVSGAARRHLDVLRVRPGDRFLATDGAGREFLLEAERCTRAELVAAIREERVPPPAPGEQTTLAVAPPKGARMEIAIEKAVECGVGRIVPLVAERSIVKGRGDSERAARWRRVAAAATAQSGRCRLVEISEFSALGDVLAAGGSRVLIAHPAADARSVAEALRGAGGNDLVSILVGPEGGFTEQEVERARRSGAVPVSLGPHRLRTETAAVVAVALAVASLAGGPRTGSES